MRDYVPKIIGTESFEDHIGPYSGYDPSVNPSVANVFSTAAFRFGHAAIPPVIRRLNESFEEHELFPSLELHNTLFTPWRFVKEGQDSQLPTRATKISIKHSLKEGRDWKRPERFFSLIHLAGWIKSMMRVNSKVRFRFLPGFSQNGTNKHQGWE